MTLTLTLLAFATLWVVAGLAHNSLIKERAEVARLRDENMRLMARIGYEYHIALGTPAFPHSASVPPIDLPTPPPSFRMKPSSPLTRAEREARGTS